MIVLRALAALHVLVAHARDVLGGGAAVASTAGSAWSGPWPPGSLPVCVTYGDGPPIFVGYVAASTDADPRRAELTEFWRAHATAIERCSAGGA